MSMCVTRIRVFLLMEVNCLSERVKFIRLEKDEKNLPYRKRSLWMWDMDKDKAIKEYYLFDTTAAAISIYNYRTEKMELIEFKSKEEMNDWADNPPFEYQYKPGTKVAPEDIGYKREPVSNNPEDWIWHEDYIDENGNRQTRSGTWAELNKMRGTDIKFSDCEWYDPCCEIVSFVGSKEIDPIFLPPKTQS